MQNNILTKIKKLIRRLAFLAVTFVFVKTEANEIALPINLTLCKSNIITLRKCKFIRTKTPYSL